MKNFFITIILIPLIFFVFLFPLYNTVELKASFISFSFPYFQYPDISLRLNKYQKIADINLDSSKGVFLVASQNIIEPIFSKSVILLLEYDKNGAMGLIINKPSRIKLKSVFSKARGLSIRNKTVFFGGPVSVNSLFFVVLSPKTLNSSISMRIFDDVYLVYKLSDIKKVFSRRIIKKQFHVFAGYAGWAPGQLEYEVSRGDWYIVPADTDSIFFKSTDEIWPELIKKSSSHLVFLLGTN